MESNTIDFERQYNNLDLGIFNSLKDPILHETLLNEFREVEPQPNRHLYVFDSLDHREYVEELASEESDTLRTKVNELTKQFHSKLTKEKASKGSDLLDRRYYSPFIKNTNTFKTLTKIIKLFEIYEKGLYPLRDNTPETVVKEVIRHSTTLDKALSGKVANNLINHSENRFITADAILDNKPPNPDQLIKWNAFKSEFNSSLGEWLTDNKEVVQPIQSKENEPQPETLRAMITHKNSALIVEKIKIQYKSIKGKRLKLLLLALQQLELLPSEGIGAKFHRCCKREFNVIKLRLFILHLSDF